MEELKRKGRRQPYAIALYLTPAERNRLEAAAKVGKWSVSSYVASVVVSGLE